MVGGFIPIPWVTHYRTVTIANSTTITIPINTTKTVTYTTTTVGGKIETVTMTTTYIEITTTTRIVNNTVTKIIVVPTTTTVNHTTTLTSTSLVPYPYTVTTTATIIENASQLPPFNVSNPLSVIGFVKAAYELSTLGVVNVSLPWGVCMGTVWVFPNMTTVWLAAWFIPWNVAKSWMNPSTFIYTFKTGVSEYSPNSWFSLGMLNTQNGGLNLFGEGILYMANVSNYPIQGYTVGVVGTTMSAFMTQAPWAFEGLENGTYVMLLGNSSTMPVGTAIQYALNPPAACLMQVIRVKPGTPNSYILNMTFLGAQYWAWVRSIAQYGEPAPCYMSWEWTYGYWVYHINVTEPIGGNWQYYCSPSKGVWHPLKP
jgi:hypothetical protein